MKEILVTCAFVVFAATTAQAQLQWTSVGLQNEYVGGISVNSSGHIFAATLDGLYRTTDSGVQWSDVSVGWPVRAIQAAWINPATQHLIAGAQEGSNWLLYRSTNNGDTWMDITSQVAAYVRGVGATQFGVLFAATDGGGIYRSTDDGQTWSLAYATSLTCTPVAIAPSGTIYVGTHEPSILRSTDGGGKWSTVNSMSDGYGVYSLAINPRSGHIFAGMGESGYTGIWRSTDNGANWEFLNGSGAPSMVYSLLVGPNDEVYAASTELGVCVSTDDGNTWSQENSGLPQTNAASLAFDVHGNLLVATLGEGVYSSSTSNPMECRFMGNWDQFGNAGSSRNLFFYVDNLRPSPPTQIVKPVLFDSQTGAQVALYPPSSTVNSGVHSGGFAFTVPSDSNRFFARINVDVTDSLGTLISEKEFNFRYYVSDFMYKQNNYSFTNTPDINKKLLEAMIVKLYQDFWSLNFRWGPGITAAYFIKALWGMDGLCYGMASTSILYKEHPEMLPPTFTNAYKVPTTNGQVADAIFNHHMEQIPHLFDFLTPSVLYNPKSQVEKLRDSLLHNKSQIMMIDHHAVAAYGLLDLQDSMFVYYYNENHLNLPEWQGVLREINSSSPQFYFEDKGTKVFFFTPSMLETLPQSANRVATIANKTSDAIDTNQITAWTVQYMRENGRQFFMFRDSTFDNDTLNAVNVILRNSADQRIGFVDGTAVNEVPGGLIFDAASYKLFEVPSGDTYSAEARGWHSGNFTASFLTLNSDNSARLMYYSNIVMQSSSIATANIRQDVTVIPFMIDRNGDGTPDTTVSPDYSAAVVTGVTIQTDFPMQFKLLQNYPNPFNPTTTIRYGLPQASHVTLTVFNALGQTIVVMVNETQDLGYHEVRFDGTGLASGVYFYRIQAGSFVQSKKLILLR